MTRVKICGVTLADDAALVASLDVDFIGLNFWPRSRRYVSIDRASVIAHVARSTGATTKLVGVFVNPVLDEILAVTARVDLDIIQLHGDEDVALVTTIATAVDRPVWKAIPVSTARDVEHLDAWPAAYVNAIMLDAPVAGRGGAGTRFDHELARRARERHPNVNVVLAGGLDPDNVAAAVELVQPWCVDVASGVESAPGIKDHAKLAAFVAAARR